MNLPESAKRFFRQAGARGGKIGGKLAASRMTPEQRSARARKAALARHAKRQQVNPAYVDIAHLDKMYGLWIAGEKWA